MTVPVLRTARLTLRPLADGDADAIATGLGDWQVTRWLTVVPFPYGRTDALDFIGSAGSGAQGAWAIDGGAGLIGVISLDAELGFWLDRGAHGQGIMTEAATAVIDWRFGQSDAVLVSGYHSGNDASWAVQRKLGFAHTHDETLRQVSTGREVTIHRTALGCSDWWARRG